MSAPESVRSSTPATFVFDFRQARQAPEWTPIDDVVMGGRSVSAFRLESDAAVFSGTVSLENNGGFASVRSAPGRFDLSDYAGVLLRVRGDGKTYKFNLRTDSDFDGVNYRAVFTPQRAVWTTVKLPFGAFAPTFRGRVLPRAEALDPARIVTFGLLIGDKQAGPFRLEIAWIGAWQG